MTRPTLARVRLEKAIKAYEQAQDAMLDASCDYIKDEALRLSLRLPGRKVEVFAGNGDRQILIARKRAAPYGASYNERDSFYFCGEPGLWRGTPDRLEQPEALVWLNKLDDDLGFRNATLGIVGHFVALDGCEVDS